MKKGLIALFLAGFLLSVRAQQINLVPQPVSLKQTEGSFRLSAATAVTSENRDLQRSIDFFNAYLNEYYGFKVPSVKKSKANVINLKLVSGKNRIPGAYELTVNSNNINITARDQEGIFYGIQTLIQLLPVERSATLNIPNVEIVDSPRFAYRGLMLDCGRHFFSIDFIKQYIDFIAMSKMNTFHWHLTEDQGWRIEIKKYPKLTQVGGCRNGTITGRYPGNGNTNEKYCGYYTQEQLKEIVKYAADRYITVIPEIEMPGHASAAIAAYPELSCFPDQATEIKPGITWAGPTTGKQVQQAWGVFPDIFCPSEYTFNFLKDVLDEVMELFPSKYIHIGGDEAPKEYWKKSAFCQQLIKEKGLKDEHELQSYFIQTIEKYLNSKGRKIIGWDEILEGGLAPNATVMSWRGEEGGIEAARQHHDVIMTPTTYVYFDYAQSKHEDSLTIGGYIPVEKVYNYNPLPVQLTEVEHNFILGAQANLWTEYMKTPSKVEYMLFPRLAALSEVLWTPQEKKDWEGFKKRLPGIERRYDLWKVKYNTKGIDNGQ